MWRPQILKYRPEPEVQTPSRSSILPSVFLSNLPYRSLLFFIIRSPEGLLFYRQFERIFYGIIKSACVLLRTNAPLLLPRIRLSPKAVQDYSQFVDLSTKRTCTLSKPNSLGFCTNLSVFKNNVFVFLSILPVHFFKIKRLYFFQLRPSQSCTNFPSHFCGKLQQFLFPLYFSPLCFIMIEIEEHVFQEVLHDIWQ